MSNPFATTNQVNAVVKVRRGPESDREQVIFDDGELSYSTDKKRFFVGDNLTNGGILVGNKIWYVDSFDKVPYIEGNDIVYRTDLNAFYLFYGTNPLLSSNYVLVGGKKLIDDNVNLTTYTLPNATKLVKGGVIIGNGLSANNGTLTIDYDPNVFTLDSTNKLTLKNATSLTLNDATYVSKGIVQINDGTSNSKGGLTVDNGVLSVKIDNSTLKLNTTTNVISIDNTKLPKATSSALGAIIVGSGLSVDGTGNTTVQVDGSTVKINSSGQLESTTGGGGGGTAFELWDAIGKKNTNKLTINDGLNVSSNGTLDLQAASPLAIGGIKVGDGLKINTLTGLLCANVDNKTIELNSSGQLQLVVVAAPPAPAPTPGSVAIGGFILKWGTTASAAIDTSIAVTFGTAFPTNCFNVVITQSLGTLLGGSNGVASVRNLTTTGFTLDNGADGTGSFFYQAIGN